MFTYKIDENKFLKKHKICLMMKNNFQKFDIQNVYAATLTLKIFRFFMTLMTVFDLQTFQFNVINAFLNAENDVSIYCFLSNDYKKPDKMIKMLKALYDQKKFPLL